MCDDFQIDRFLNDGVIIRVLLETKKKKESRRAKVDRWCLRSLRGDAYHLGRKFLEELADQASRGFGVGHHGVQELLQDLLQGGGSVLNRDGVS